MSRVERCGEINGSGDSTWKVVWDGRSLKCPLYTFAVAQTVVVQLPCRVRICRGIGLRVHGLVSFWWI